jgi:predicted ATP-binding protein involved in virulence
MIFRLVHKYVIILVLICFSISIHAPISLAKIENDSKQQAFSNFEKEIFDLIKSSIESLNKLDEELDEESLYNIALSAEQKLAENSLTLAQLKVPTTLSDDIKTSLEKIKGELSIGFKVLEKSMNQLARYIVKRNPLLYDKFIKNRDKGFLYIDGVLTSLTTIRLQIKQIR